MNQPESILTIELDMDQIPRNHHPLLDKLSEALADTEGDVGFNCLGIMHSMLAQNLVKQDDLKDDTLCQILSAMLFPILGITRALARRRPQLIDRLATVEFCLMNSIAMLKGQPNAFDKIPGLSAPRAQTSQSDVSSDLRQRIASMTQ